MTSSSKLEAGVHTANRPAAAIAGAQGVVVVKKETFSNAVHLHQLIPGGWITFTAMRPIEGLAKGTGHIAVERFPGFKVDLGLVGCFEALVGAVLAEEMA